MNDLEEAGERAAFGKAKRADR